MTGRIRFVRADLEYGCHARGSVEIPEKDSPVVIAGPNGSGKTTLVEALVRTLFGFDRRQPADRDGLDARIPWAGEECRAVVEIRAADGRRYRVRREFGDGEVEIEPLDGGPTWTGDGNPAAGNQEAIEYRRRLAEIFGLSEIEHYESTSCIAQGRLLDTRLRDELLQIEAGGYGNVDEARKRIQDAHGRLTTRSIEGDGRAKPKARRLELADAEIQRLDSRLKSAEAAFSWRAPLEKEVDDARARRDRLDEEIALLEAALGPLNERRTLTATVSALRERQAAAEKSRHRLERAIRHHEATEDAVAIPHEERYPADFLERVGRIEWMWDRRSALRAERDRLEAAPRTADVPRPWIAPAVTVLLAGIGALAWVLAGALLPLLVCGALAVMVGTALALHRATVVRRRDRALREKQVVYGELDTLAKEFTKELEGVPRARTLSPATIDERKQAFEVQRKAGEKLAAAAEALEEEIRDAARTLAAGGSGGGTDGSGPARDRGADVLARCEAAAESVRTDVARVQLRMESLEGQPLPEGVEGTPEAVEAALGERRAERREVERTAREAESRLLREGTGDESPIALRDELAVAEAERAAIDLEARVHEIAFALVRDAYEAFREHDQERLVAAVSASIEVLSGGAIGPVEAPGPLADATIRLHGRSVELRSPPLSYGEFHVALLGIRLGAGDFLARSGIHPPLIVDEPFAYLDDARSAELWRLLCQVARERQVLVVTQETLTLAALGVAPDIVLSAPASRGGTSPSATTP